jgi:hypothetical protein
MRPAGSTEDALAVSREIPGWLFSPIIFLILVRLSADGCRTLIVAEAITIS